MDLFFKLQESVIVKFNPPINNQKDQLVDFMQDQFSQVPVEVIEKISQVPQESRLIGFYLIALGLLVAGVLFDK